MLRRLSLCISVFICAVSVSAQQQVFKISDKESGASVMQRLAEEQSLLLAYPSDILSTFECKEKTLSYKNLEDLVGKLTDYLQLDYYKYDQNKYLIKALDKEIDDRMHISGRIVDSETGEALMLASIYCSDYSSGVFSNASGAFEMDIDASFEGSIVISFVGYETIYLDASDLTKGRMISMNLSAQELSSPIISYVVPPIQYRRDGSVTSESDQFSNGALASGLYGRDLLRYIQMLGGVSAFEDDDVNLKIRGSNHEGSRIILNGMPLYNVNHYYGIFSSINTNYVDAFSLYKNAQPIQYEGMSGGLVILKSEPQEDKVQSLDVSLLTASVSLDLPISEKWSFKTAGRSSFRNVSNTNLVDLNSRNSQNFSQNDEGNVFISNQPEFDFYDVNAGLFYKSENTALAFNFFRSHDALYNSYNLELNLQNQSINRQIFLNEESWATTAASFQLTQQLGQKSQLHVNAYMSDYDLNSLTDAELQSQSTNNMLSNTNTNFLVDRGLNAYVASQVGRGDLSYGLEYKNLSIGNNLIAESGASLIDYEGDAAYTSLFSEYALQLDRLNITGALRVPMYEPEGKSLKLLFSPQLSFNYLLDENLQLKWSVSRTNQVLREIQYESRLGQNLSFYQFANKKSVPVLRTDNYMLGFNYSKGRWGLDVELFYKDLDGVLLLSSNTPGFVNNPGVRPPRTNEYRSYSGERRVYGIDISYSLRMGHYTGWLAYTLSKSDDRYQRVFKGDYFASQDDRRHQVKWINELKWGSWSINNNWVFASGRPYLALETITVDDREVLDPRENIRRLPDYFRMDLAVNHHFVLAGKEASLGISVYNLTNRQNVQFLQYAYKLNINQGNELKDFILGTESELLNRSLNLNFNLKF